MRILTSTSRRFTRTNDYRLGRSAPRVRAKDGIHLARPLGSHTRRPEEPVTRLIELRSEELRSAA